MVFYLQNVTYEEACALSYFREGEIMKGLREIAGADDYRPVLVNEVKAIIASEALMYSTDLTSMLRKPHNEPLTYIDLNSLYNEMAQKMPSYVKIMDFIKHAVPTGKRQRDIYSYERREAIVASIMAKSLCTFNSKLDAYKIQLSSLLLNNGTSGEFELDLLAETNDTYPHNQKRRFMARTRESKNDVVVYKDKSGKCKMINLYDLVKYDPADGASEGEEGEEGESGAQCSIDASSSNQQPFMLLTKPNVGSRKRKGGPQKKRAPKKSILSSSPQGDENPLQSTSALSDSESAAVEYIEGEEVEQVIEEPVEMAPNPMDIAMAVISSEIDMPVGAETEQATEEVQTEEVETEGAGLVIE